jgi:methylenetetrahydrofolate reductase (NADPH)
MRDKGELPTGKKIGGKAEFFIAAADVPSDPKPGWEPASLKAKIAAGCEFVQTQFCMDVAVARRYMARLAEHGVKTPFLIGISPLRSAKSARWMKEKLFGTIIPDSIVVRLEAAADPAAEGKRI